MGQILLLYSFREHEAIERSLMYTLIVKGARRATLAVHHCESLGEVRELLAVYHALGYSDEALAVEEQREDRAA